MPDDTEFTARVDCWFPANQPPGQGRRRSFRGRTFSVVLSRAWSATCRVNSQCRVTETDTNGASAVVDPAGLFPVDADPVEVTITNTFPAGQLTVEKVVTDPSGLVATPHAVHHQRGLHIRWQAAAGYPQDVGPDLRHGPQRDADGPARTGPTCMLTEPDLNGAGSVTFQPGGGTSATVTIGPAPNDDVTVTATNDYPAGTFPIEKSVIGPGAGFVPADTEFEVTATCTLPGRLPRHGSGPVRGDDQGGQTVVVPTGLRPREAPAGGHDLHRGRDRRSGCRLRPLSCPTR